jgi:YjbE family integral membrane protein
MGFLTDPEFWARWLSIVIIDLTLAGDNALVIALAVRTLPRRQQFWGRIWGTIGAVGLRLAFIAVITYLLRIPLLQFVGGLLLVWIAIKLIRQDAGGEGEGHVRQGTSLVQAVWIIIVADVVMSLDNVLAVAAAAHGDLILVIFGIALSLPLVVWGSGILARLMGRYPWIVWLGGGILGYVAGEMILKDRVIQQWVGEGVIEILHYPLPLVLGIGITGLGWWIAREARHGRKIPEKA